MSNLNELPSGPQSVSSNSKPLWAAVGILGVAVLGMGGTMIYNQRPAAPAAIVASAPQPSAALPALSSSASVSAADDLVEKPVMVIPPTPAPVHVKKVVKHIPKPQPAPEIYAPVAAQAAPAPYVAPAQYPVQAAVCHQCGTIESVTPVTRSTKAAGVGVGSVAGGLLGAVLGNQVGHGNGRAAATILGAVGGGFAGNAVEGHMKQETVYSVGVRMEDGSHRVLELPQPPQVGRQVTVEGSTMRDR